MSNNIQPDKFQFIVNVNGISDEVLVNAPEGWLGTTIKFTRSKTYLGLFRGLSEPTKFVNKGARLLRQQFYTKGILSFVKFVINLQNPFTWGYNLLYSGRLDFSTAVDELTSFTVNSINDDFTVKLSANDSTEYSIPLDTTDSINVELTPLTLKETASFVPSAPPDGNVHSDYFPPMQLAANQQNGVNYSSQQVQYSQLRNPNFSTSNSNFFFSRVNGKLTITGSLQGNIINGGMVPAHLKLYIINNSGVVRLSLVDMSVNTGATPFNIALNQVITVSASEKLFLYMQQVEAETATTGITITGGQIDLAYNTISPATMCKTLPASIVFGKLLQAMNTNTDSGPNQPVAYKSNLLTGDMANLMITSSDSIRLATGSLFIAGDTIFPGTYQVVAGSVVYGGNTFTLNQTFPYLPSVLTFTSTTGGVIEKIISGFVGTVYNPGDTLQAGGTYLIGGNVGTIVTYNSIPYIVGGATPQFFTYILGQETFSGNDPTSFVEQTGFSPQLIISFKDFWQSIYSVQGGNAAFGIENGVCFIETLDYVYRGTIGNLDAGIVDTAIKIQPATDIIPNTIKTGYRDSQFSTLNGYFEVNSTQNYATSILHPQKELNLISIINAAPYMIEEIRISQNDTAASRSDNAPFFVYKNTAPVNTVPFTYYHPMRTEGLMTNPGTGLPMISGVDSSYYNWIISPKRNLLRGGNYLASLFYNMAGYKITLSSAPKNTAMITTDISGVRVAENEPIYISALAAPLFIPIYCTFKPGLAKNALQMIDSVPYGFITFKYNSVTYKMFADMISVNIGENAQQEFKGLLTPGNDITTLIH
jgi:hypothetical protein